MKRSIFLIVGITMIFSAIVFAQDPDDPGAPDSLIFGNAEVAYNPGQDIYIDVPVYFVTDDSIASLMLPLDCSSSDGNITINSVTYEEPFDQWEDFYVNDDHDWIVGFHDLTDPANEPLLFTNGSHQLAFSIEFRIAAGAEEQFVPITVGQGPHNLPVNFAPPPATTDKDVTPVIVDGFVRYGAVGVNDDVAALPTEFAIMQNYPNPFNPETNIEYQLPKDGYVDISIYNILGQNVRTLVSEVQQAGIYKAHWDGASNSGATVPSGIYFYTINAGDYSDTKKMVMLK